MIEGQILLCTYGRGTARQDTATWLAVCLPGWPLLELTGLSSGVQMERVSG
jgi:hypothetical protein